MPRHFDPTLINDPFDDPRLYVDLVFERRALLFDLGDLSRLAPRKLLRVSDIFVTHRHMDHFAGFDQLLRLLLGREKAVGVYGPTGLKSRRFITTIPEEVCPNDLDDAGPCWPTTRNAGCGFWALANWGVDSLARSQMRMDASLRKAMCVSSGERIGNNQRRQTLGFGARTTVGSLEAVFELGVIERSSRNLWMAA